MGCRTPTRSSVTKCRPVSARCMTDSTDSVDDTSGQTIPTSHPITTTVPTKEAVVKTAITFDEKQLAEAVNAKLDIPYVPEAVEKRLFAEGVEAGAKAVVEIMGSYANESITVTVE